MEATTSLLPFTFDLKKEHLNYYEPYKKTYCSSSLDLPKEGRKEGKKEAEWMSAWGKQICLLIYAYYNTLYIEYSIINRILSARGIYIIYKEKEME